MSHLKLATLALLLAGSTALPAGAQNSGLPGAVRDAQYRAEARERDDDREERRSYRGDRSGEQPGGGAPYAGTGSRDDGDLVFQSVHGGSPLCVWRPVGGRHGRTRRV